MAEREPDMQDFRRRVRDGNTVLGTFIKTASHQIPELLAAGGLDFAVIDAEHAPFGPADFDRMALAAKACALPCLVRVPETGPAAIGQILDLGLSGIMVPHVSNADAAARALDAAKYHRGRRGFSPSTRSAGYVHPDGRAFRDSADAASCVWCQIEDAEALAHLDAIAALDDIDCLFLGRADLALSLGADGPGHPKVVAAVAATAEAGRKHRRSVGIHISSTAEIPALRELGMTVFVCGSDQSFLIAQALQAKRDLSALLAAPRAS